MNSIDRIARVGSGVLRSIALIGAAALSFSCEAQKQNAQPLPEVIPSVASEIPEVSGEQAFKFLLRQTDFGPRAPNTPGHRNCLEFLHQQLTEYADAVNLQPFTHTGRDGIQYSLTNVIASFNSKATDRILLTAHWDTRPWADQDADTRNHSKPIIGANDGASGVAVLLEIARHLHGTSPPIGVDIIFFDGEDLGATGSPESFSAGAKFFAANKSMGFRPRFGINIDMVGDKVLEIPREVNSDRYARNVMDLIFSTARTLGLPQFTHAEGSEIYDDHIPLNNVGIPTADLIDFHYPDRRTNYWHTLADTPDQCSPESLAAVGQVLLHILYTGAKTP